MTMHFLVIGFSVTEMPSSYVPILKRLTTERGFDVEVDHCGIGGVTIEDLLYMLDRILETRPA